MEMFQGSQGTIRLRVVKLSSSRKKYICCKCCRSDHALYQTLVLRDPDTCGSDDSHSLRDVKVFTDVSFGAEVDQ